MSIKQKYRTLLILIFLLSIIISSCEKDEVSYDITGKVYDPQLDKNVSDVKVVLRGSKVQYGIYNTAYIDLQNTKTSSDGTYSFEVPYETVTGYRFYFQKENYFDQLIDVNTDDIQQTDGYRLDIDLIPIAYLDLTIKNTSPQGSDDEIRVRMTNINVQCKDCWNTETIIGEGPMFSYKRKAMLTGEKDILINWVVKKGGQQHVYNDTIHTHAFKTITYDINY
jgi:hypothetical protein